MKRREVEKQRTTYETSSITVVLSMTVLMCMCAQGRRVYMCVVILRLKRAEQSGMSDAKRTSISRDLLFSECISA